MSKLIVTDDLWELVESLIPRHEPSPKGGRKPVDDRVCLTGILFVLKTGIAWEDFPQEMGCCGMTLWNRLHDWMKAGVWAELHALLLSKLHQAGAIDWSRATADSGSVRAVRGGKKNRAQSRGSCQKGHQAPRADRRQGHAAGRDGDGGQSPRLDAAVGAGGRRASGAGQAWAADASPGVVVRRPGVRQRPASRGAEASGHHAPHRPPQHRARQRTGQGALCRRADAGVAASVQAAADAV